MDGDHSSGGVGFIEEIRDDLGVRALGRSIVPDGEQHQLREAQAPYTGHFDPERGGLRLKTALNGSFILKFKEVGLVRTPKLSQT